MNEGRKEGRNDRRKEGRKEGKKERTVPSKCVMQSRMVNFLSYHISLTFHWPSDPTKLAIHVQYNPAINLDNALSLSAISGDCEQCIISSIITASYSCLMPIAAQSQPSLTSFSPPA